MVKVTVITAITYALYTHHIPATITHSEDALHMAATNPTSVISQKYGGEDPHGADPHGTDSHAEYHDKYLPANEATTYHTPSGDVYNDKYNNSSKPVKPAPYWDDTIK